MPSRHTQRLILLLLALPAGVQAQQVREVRGIVAERSGAPIGGAEVFLDDRRSPVTTGPDGRFRLDSVRAGPHWLLARRIGYAPQRRAVTVIEGENREVVFLMEALPVWLPDIEVQGESGYRNGWMRDFWFRSKSGWGKFATRDDLERSGAPQLSFFLRRWMPMTPLSTLEVNQYQYGASISGLRRPSGLPEVANPRTRRCPPAVSLNGTPPMYGPNSVDDYPVSMIEAVEVYRGGTMSVPMEYSTYRGVGCGLVIVWLK